MKSKLTALYIGMCGAVMLAGSAVAGDVVTRSVEDAQADLMRTWKTHGGQPAGHVRTRSADDCYADLMRNWNARSSGAPGSSIKSRTQDDAYADLMRASFSIAVAK